MAGVEDKKAHEVALRKEAETLRGKGYKVRECFREGRFSKLCRAFYDEKAPPPMADIRTPLVCKIMEKDSLPHIYSRKLLPMQMEVLGRLDHPNIVRIHSILASQHRYFIFMEDCEVGNLFDFLHRHGPLTPGLARYWLRQVLQALAYCHYNSITHRNLTVKNILITRNRDVRLTGFDFSTIISRRALNRTTCGSAYYIPPEILAGVAYDAPKGDVWCAGVVFVYMLTRIYAFPAIKPMKLLKLQQQGIEKSGAWGTLATISDEIQEFIKTFFKLNPGKRPSVPELFQNSWMKDTRKSKPVTGQNRDSLSTNEESGIFEPRRRNEDQRGIDLESKIHSHIQNSNKRRTTFVLLQEGEEKEENLI